MIVIRISLVAGLCAATSLAAQQSFVEVAASRGLGGYLQAPGMSAGAAAEDFDGDGDIDVFVPTACGQPDLLFRNRGDGHFEEVGERCGVASLANHRGALWFDADSDGDLDLVVGGDEFQEFDCGAPSSLLFYEQQPGGTFEERSREAGLSRYLSVAEDTHLGGLAAGDLDLDGDLDLIVTFWEGYTHVYRNDGGGRFANVAAQLGLQAWRAHWQPVIHDFDGDGWPDIFQAVDFAPNALWINQSGQSFVDQAQAAGVDNAFNEMGVALGDIDADGDFDVYVTNLYGPGEWNTLFRRSTPGLQFDEIAQKLGVDNGGCGWGAVFVDADHSGWLDLATTNSCAGDSSRFFRGTGNGRFADASDLVGYNDTEAGSGLLELDMDRDGDLDLLQVCGFPGRLLLYENQLQGPADSRNWLVVQPREASGAPAIGAVVRVSGDGHGQARVLVAGSSLLSQSPAEAHFGLGTTDAVEVRVEWVDGTVTVMDDVQAGQVLTVVR